MSTMPPLLAQYATAFGPPASPQFDAMLTIAPLRRLRWGIAARLRKNALDRLQAIVSCQIASVVSSAVAACQMPALLTRRSRPPKASTQAATSWAQACDAIRLPIYARTPGMAAVTARVRAAARPAAMTE
jgi:hypothetical protein